MEKNRLEAFSDGVIATRVVLREPLDEGHDVHNVVGRREHESNHTRIGFAKANLVNHPPGIPASDRAERRTVGKGERIGADPVALATDVSVQIPTTSGVAADLAGCRVDLLR